MAVAPLRDMATLLMSVLIGGYGWTVLESQRPGALRRSPAPAAASASCPSRSGAAFPIARRCIRIPAERTVVAPAESCGQGVRSASQIGPRRLPALVLLPLAPERRR